MATPQRKTELTLMTDVFGFPVILLNVPMVRCRGEWIADVDYNKIGEVLLRTLANKSARLSGNEVRFIRTSWKMTLAQFGRRFAVGHSAVINWERSGDKPTSMEWATEKDIVLELLRRTGADPEAFKAAYEALASKRPAGKRTPTSLDISRELKPAA